MEEKFSILLFFITVADLYFNYYSNDFPEYHNARIYSDILSLICIFTPIFLVLSVCCIGLLLFFHIAEDITIQKCTFCLTLLSVLLVILSAMGSSAIQIYSIYLYFTDDGSTKIQNTIIKYLMWITFINIIIKIFFAFCDCISSVKKNKNENKEEGEKMVELEDQN